LSVLLGNGSKRIDTSVDHSYQRRKPQEDLT